MKKYIGLFLAIIVGCLLLISELEVYAMEDQPEFFMSQVSMGTGPGVRRLAYGNAYLPEIITKVKTEIELLEFNYPSFDQVEVKIVFRNIVDSGTLEKGIYKKGEEWKAKATSLSKPNYQLYPFFCLFLGDNPADSINLDDVTVYSKISDVELLDESNSKVKFEILFNKIVYLPDSYYKLYDLPKSEKQKYRFFAGHNYLMYLPLDGKKYSLTFRIQNYLFDYSNGKVTSIVPMIFFSSHVEIKKYVVSYSGRYEISASLYKNVSLDKPINPNVPMMFGFKGPSIKVGEYVKNILPPELKYDETLLLFNQHVLTPKQEISVGAKSIDCPVPLSIYDLLKKNRNVLVPPIMEYFVLNRGSADTDLTLRTEILELTQPDIQKITVKPGEIKRVTFVPTFIYDKAENLKAPKDYTVYCSCRDSTGATIEEKTFKIRVLPRTTMLWSMLDLSTGLSQWYFEYIVNWVTPHIDSKKADEVLRSTLERVALKSLGGYSETLFAFAQSKGLLKTRKEYIRDIVKSLYDSVGELQPRYSNETLDFGRSESQFLGQRISYPKETLEHGRGNCIDTTVMFASLLEQIGLNPVIVIIPGHAFLGWETWENSDEYEYLETTMVGYENFETARKKGMETEQKYLGEKSFDPMPYGPDEIWPMKVNIKKARESGLYTSH